MIITQTAETVTLLKNSLRIELLLFSFFVNLFFLSFVFFLCSCLHFLFCFLTYPPYLYPVTVFISLRHSSSSYLSLFISVLPSVISPCFPSLISVFLSLIFPSDHFHFYHLSLFPLNLLHSLAVLSHHFIYICLFPHLPTSPDPSPSSSLALALPPLVFLSLTFFSPSSILHFTLIQADMSLATPILIVGTNWSNENTKLVRSKFDHLYHMLCVCLSKIL